MNTSWMPAWQRLRADRVAMAALAVVAGFLLLVALAAAGLVAADWEEEVADSYAPPRFMAAPAPAAAPGRAAAAAPPNEFDPLAREMAELSAAAVAGHERVRGAAPLFGADKWGHDIVKKTVKGAQTSVVVGLMSAVLAVALGSLCGALAGFYGGWVDAVFEWIYTVFTAIPAILMILAVAAVLQQKGVATIVLILGLTGWTGPFRLMRAEYMKHRVRDYVLAAQAIGASGWRRMFVHIFPNVSHVALVQLAIMAVGFIKAEVILSFLGFGVPVGAVSWGSMLNEAQQELLLGKWWQLLAASTAMAALVTALSLLTDAVRDALDPKAGTA